MGAIKEKSKVKIHLVTRIKNFFNKFYCKFKTFFLSFIPSFFKKKKKYVDVNKQQGLPYILCVENITSKEIKNVELFGSYNMLSQDGFEENGDYCSRGLKITSSIPSISYKQILHAMTFVKFKVGLTYIMTVNQKQIFHPLKVVKKTIDGNLNENILIVTKDPYQQQKNIVALKSTYEIDGLTSVVIPKIEPKTKVVYYFYPKTWSLSNVEQQNLGFRFFKSISDYFKKKEIIKNVYTIEVANHTDEVKKDVSLFGSFMKINNSNKNNCSLKGGNLIINDVVISSLTPNISYAEMLYHTMNNPINVKLSYIRNLKGSKFQFASEFKIKTSDVVGNVHQRKSVPTIDPYQYQDDVLISNQKFGIDGFTEFIISELQPKTIVVYQFYSEIEEKK